MVRHALGAVAAFGLCSVCALAVQAQQPANPQPAPGSSGGLQAGGLAPPPPMPNDPNAPPRHQWARPRSISSRSPRSRTPNAASNGSGSRRKAATSTSDWSRSSRAALTYGTVATRDGGLMYGAAVGVRLLFLTIGLRGRMAHFTDWRVGSLNAEVGFHIPPGNWDFPLQARRRLHVPRLAQHHELGI